jgi:hypothetical protein
VNRAEVAAELLGLIERIVDTRVEAKLAERGLIVEYTTRTLPPGVSRRVFVETCRRLPAARRDGRVWVCPVSAWRAARAAGPPHKQPVPANDDTRALLAAAGLRATARGGRR